MKIKPGINYDITDKIYFADKKYMTRSSFLGLLNSVNHFKKEYNPEPTKAFKIGNMLDTLLTNSEEFYKIYTKAFIGDKRTKIGKALYAEWLKDNKDKKVISENDLILLRNMAESLFLNPETAKYFDKSNKYLYQVTVADNLIVDDDKKIPFKVRTDIWKEHDNYIEVVDLKTTAKLKDIEKSIEKYNYYLQDYLYSRIIAFSTGKPVTFKFIFVEKVHPFDSIEIELSDLWYDIAEDKLNHVLVPRYLAQKATKKRLFTKGKVIDPPKWLKHD